MINVQNSYLSTYPDKIRLFITKRRAPDLEKRTDDPSATTSAQKEAPASPGTSLHSETHTEDTRETSNTLSSSRNPTEPAKPLAASDANWDHATYEGFKLFRTDLENVINYAPFDDASIDEFRTWMMPVMDYVDLLLPWKNPAAPRFKRDTDPFVQCYICTRQLLDFIADGFLSEKFSWDLLRKSNSYIKYAALLVSFCAMIAVSYTDKLDVPLTREFTKRFIATLTIIDGAVPNPSTEEITEIATRQQESKEEIQRDYQTFDFWLKCFCGAICQFSVDSGPGEMGSMYVHFEGGPSFTLIMNLDSKFPILPADSEVVYRGFLRQQVIKDGIVVETYEQCRPYFDPVREPPTTQRCPLFPPRNHRPYFGSPYEH